MHVVTYWVNFFHIREEIGYIDMSYWVNFFRTREEISYIDISLFQIDQLGSVQFIPTTVPGPCPFQACNSLLAWADRTATHASWESTRCIYFDHSFSTLLLQWLGKKMSPLPNLTLWRLYSHKHNVNKI